VSAGLAERKKEERENAGAASPSPKVGLRRVHVMLLKGVAKKRGVLNFIILAYIYSKKMIDIHF
jgi:hypothetical protein